MDLIPEGRFGYTAQEHAQRLTCTATIFEMSMFSLILSCLFSHDSMSHHELRGNSPRPSPCPTPAPTFAGVLEAEPAGETECTGGHGAAVDDDVGGGKLAARRDGSAAQKAEGLEHRVNGILFEQMIGRTVHEAARRNADSVEAVSLWSVRF
jgi:hypothetical protein